MQLDFLRIFSSVGAHFLSVLSNILLSDCTTVYLTTCLLKNIFIISQVQLSVWT